MKRILTNVWTFIKTHHEPLGVLLTFWSVLLALVATTAAFWAVSAQNKASRELASQQNFLQFYQQWESEGMQERRARLAATLLESSTPTEIDDSPLVFLETLSNATNKHITDHDLTWNAFYYDLTNYWAAASEYAKKLRIDENCECIFRELETTNDLFVAEAKLKQGGKIASKEQHEASVRRFLQWEVKRQLNATEDRREVKAEDSSKPQEVPTHPQRK